MAAGEYISVSSQRDTEMADVQTEREQQVKKWFPLQPLSARCMRMLLHFRVGAHSLPLVLDRRLGVLRDQRLCQRCRMHDDDERHFVFGLPCHAASEGPAPCFVWPWPAHHAIVHMAGRPCGSSAPHHGLFLCPRGTV